jgi:hypothetical protein
MDENSPDDPPMFQFVEAGMRLTYEFEALGILEAGLGHTIEFFPLLSVRGWSSHKEVMASLRLVHRAGDRREIGRCLLDQDEVDAWERLFRPMRDGGPCDSAHEGVRVQGFEYASRHGIRLVWQRHMNPLDTRYRLYVSAQQAALLPSDFLDQFLTIFNEFAALRRRYE